MIRQKQIGGSQLPLPKDMFRLRKAPPPAGPLFQAAARSAMPQATACGTWLGDLADKPRVQEYPERFHHDD